MKNRKLKNQAERMTASLGRGELAQGFTVIIFFDSYTGEMDFSERYGDYDFKLSGDWNVLGYIRPAPYRRRFVRKKSFDALVKLWREYLTRNPHDDTPFVKYMRYKMDSYNIECPSAYNWL